MSHGITATDNLFTTRVPAWHQLGTVFTDYPTREQAQKAAHDWEPIATTVYRKVPTIDADGNLTETYEEVPSHVIQERSDNGDVLGVTRQSFVTVKNSEMYDVAEALESGAPGDVMYETGGSLDGGGRVWLMLRLKEPLIIQGDPHGATVPYYLLQNGHNTSSSFRGSATLIRAVCANTIAAADMDSKLRGTEFTFSHTKNIADRVEEARGALAGWRESVEAYRQLAEVLIDQKVSAAGEREFLERFIPAPLSTMTSDRVKDNIAAARDQWTACYRSVTCEGITGTAWGLLQASSEWSEHIRAAKTEASRFKRSVLDRNDVISLAKTFAIEAARL